MYSCNLSIYLTVVIIIVAEIGHIRKVTKFYCIYNYNCTDAICSNLIKELATVTHVQCIEDMQYMLLSCNDTVKN